MMGVNINQDDRPSTPPTLLASEFGYRDRERRPSSEDDVFADRRPTSPEDLVAARAGRHHHGSRRPRQDLAARRHPQGQRRRRRGRRHHPAHRRLQGPRRRRRRRRLPRHAGPRGLHGHARARRPGDRHRRPRRRGRRRRHAADHRGASTTPRTPRCRSSSRSTRSTSRAPTPSAIRQQAVRARPRPRGVGRRDHLRRRVGARPRPGIDKLLRDDLALQAEVLELKANPNKPARGIVIEAQARPRPRRRWRRCWSRTARCASATLVVAGEHIGKVRAMLDDKGQTLDRGRSLDAGRGARPRRRARRGRDRSTSSTDEKAAKALVEHRRDCAAQEGARPARPSVSLENILEQHQGRRGQGAQGRPQGRRAGLGRGARQRAHASCPPRQVRVNVISAGVGGITESRRHPGQGVGSAIIIGFHVRPAGKAQQLAEQEGVDIKLYDIIYDAHRRREEGDGRACSRRSSARRRSARPRCARSSPSRRSAPSPAASSLDGKITRKAQMRAGARLGADLHRQARRRCAASRTTSREVAQGYECGIGHRGLQRHQGRRHHRGLRDRRDRAHA